MEFELFSRMTEYIESFKSFCYIYIENYLLWHDTYMKTMQLMLMHDGVGALVASVEYLGRLRVLSKVQSRRGY